ncbi:hypothetical protein GAY31_11395 [Azospirillum brasilense]|nr:hypothetical protein [Azospirillum brasilense]
MATFTSYSQVGKKEDIADIVYNISPTETPFTSICGKRKVKNRLYQWQEDSLAAPAVNAQVEGFTATDATLSPTVLRDNMTQIFSKTFKISETARAIDTYGREDELAYQSAKASQEIKRDLEHALVGTGQTKVAGSSSVASQTAGAQAQIDASVTTAAGAAALTENHYLTTKQKVYLEGGDTDVFMVKPTDSLVVAGWSGAAGRTRDFNDGNTTLTNVVNVYVSPFGTDKVVINRFLKSTDALLVSKDSWNLAVLRPWTREELAKDGDSTKMMIVGEYGLMHTNTKGSGLITGLN